MVVGAPQMGSRLTLKRDPRITSIGRLLRRTKLDELPQLINILLGEMSLIGPQIAYLRELTARIVVEPGIATSTN